MRIKQNQLSKLQQFRIGYNKIYTDYNLTKKIGKKRKDILFKDVDVLGRKKFKV
jgi:hypothetical protein